MSTKKLFKVTGITFLVLVLIAVGLIAFYFNHIQAFFHKKTKNWDKEITSLSIIIDKEPNNIKALKRRADIYYRKKDDYQKAIADLTKVIKIAPNDIEALKDRALTYYQAFMPDERAADLEKILEILNKCLQKNPESIEDLQERGDLYSHRFHQHDNGLVDLKKAYELSKAKLLEIPNEDRLRSVYGLSYRVKMIEEIIDGKKSESNEFFKKMIIVFDQLIQKKTDFKLAIIERGKAYLELKNYKKAFEDFNQMIEIDSKSAQGYYWRGFCYLMLDSYDKALADLDKACKYKYWRGLNQNDPIVWLDQFHFGGFVDQDLIIEKLLKYYPDKHKIYSARAYHYRDTGEIEKATKAFDDLLEHGGFAQDIYYDRGWMYKSHGKYNEAIEDFTKSFKSGRPPPAERAECYLKKGYYKNAITDCNSIINSTTKYPNISLKEKNYERAYRIRGIANLEMHKPEKALEDLNQAVELDPKGYRYENFLYRGDVYIALGKWVEAIEDYKKSTELTQYDNRAYIGIAKAYEGMGNKSEAIRFYKVYIMYEKGYQPDIDNKKIEYAKSRIEELSK